MPSLFKTSVSLRLKRYTSIQNELENTVEKFLRLFNSRRLTTHLSFEAQRATNRKFKRNREDPRIARRTISNYSLNYIPWKGREWMEDSINARSNYPRIVSPSSRRRTLVFGRHRENLSSLSRTVKTWECVDTKRGCGIIASLALN